jgi:hypothetical protein
MPTLAEIVRSRTRRGWVEFGRQKLLTLRNWIQDHGERAAILACVLGMLLVIFFKLFVFFVALAVIIAYLVWYFAPVGEGP